MKLTINPCGNDGTMAIRADDELIGIYNNRNNEGFCEYGVMSSLEGMIAPSVPAAIVAILAYTGILTTDAQSESVH